MVRLGYVPTNWSVLKRLLCLVKSPAEAVDDLGKLLGFELRS